ncbi:MAG: ATPase domain-containing protein [Gemmatimonadales bacterium]|nr:ATPase domain-containing protein [Gemmatimonadales bacterium]
MSTLVPSGLAPLDRQIGGFLQGRPYLVSGNPGTGKSCACLEFLDAGVQSGERALLLTHDDPADLLDSAEFLGIDLGESLLADKLVIVTYQLDFVRRFMRAATPSLAFDELVRCMGETPVQRIAIDSIVPFLEGGGAGTQSIFALVEFLDALGATALITYPGDLAGLYDQRLEPLLQRAGGVFHLSASEHGRRRGAMQIRKLRHQAPSIAPVRYRIEAGFGYAQDGEPNVKEETLVEELRRRLLLVRLGAPFPDDLLAALQARFAVTVRGAAPPQFAESVRDGIGALILCVQRETMEDGLQVVRQLRAGDVRTPIILVTPFHLRASDRTRALRAGADDFLGTKIAEPEFIERLRAIVRRGRSKAQGSRDQGIPLVLQPLDDAGRYQLFDGPGFAQTVQGVAGAVRDPFFTLLRLEVPGGDPAALAGLLIRTLRVDSGDFVGLRDDGVVAYLEGARPSDVDGLLQRIDTAWAAEGGAPLRAETLGVPLEAARLPAFLGEG